MLWNRQRGKDDYRCIHEPCLCVRMPGIGARFRRMRRDVMTGAELGHQHFTLDRFGPKVPMICRHAILICDETGAEARVQIPNLWEFYEAIGNIVEMKRAG